ncbi:hypothetical protein [Roseobacter sinensis]|uniref:Uncharacterized protein n=1 Tax=Roseobacter sinensis TaxID=2931391 RepID=A0ABT3BL11_9RHOB|nr:hypothetical protein [Roseobacter sp. WL0113]MCV3274255.1 hypothetical protein [Roseobacter sp. WL0113]
MAGQSTTLDSLFQERMYLISALSQANADCLRALQTQSGHSILMMMEQRCSSTVEAQGNTNDEVDACRARIDRLEAELSQLDLKIEHAAREGQ